MASYRDAISYLADLDDVDSSKEFPSVCVSMVASLFNKTTDKVVEDTERSRANESGASGAVLRIFVSEMTKLGMQKLTLKKGRDYSDLFHLSFEKDDSTIHAILWEKTKGKLKYVFKINFSRTRNESGQQYFTTPNWEIQMDEIDFKTISGMIIKAMGEMR